LRNLRGGRGNVGIIRSPVRASILPDHRSCLRLSAMPALLQNGGAQTLEDALAGHHAHLLRVGGDRPKKAQQCDELYL
jgi:hypothetical protein